MPLEAKSAWGDVTADLAWTAHHRGGQLVVANVDAQTKNARRDRVGQKNGSSDMGDADEERGLQGSGAGSCDMIIMSDDQHWCEGGV